MHVRSKFIGYRRDHFVENFSSDYVVFDTHIKIVCYMKHRGKIKKIAKIKNVCKNKKIRIINLDKKIYIFLI